MPVLAVASLLAIAGCGQKSDLEKVILRGTVTYDEKPIPNGEIMFYPIEGTRGSTAGTMALDRAKKGLDGM